MKPDWRNLCVSSTPDGGFADCADFAEALPPPPTGLDGGFAYYADFALEKKKYTLSLKKETPVDYPDGGSSPGVPPPTHHNSGLSAKSAISAKPLQPGWLIAYRGLDGRLRGGADDREAGTVADCTAEAVRLTTGEAIPLARIVGVASTNQAGAITAAWLAGRHGLDGKGETS